MIFLRQALLDSGAINQTYREILPGSGGTGERHIVKTVDTFINADIAKAEMFILAQMKKHPVDVQWRRKWVPDWLYNLVTDPKTKRRVYDIW